ncbi:hypothetical protein [Gilvimarinus sp. DA14]|uniref:hypothetical protein n=1 Tax=Gilvimarinus sp. DA14 TaxID=2956798 RepID=UPI0020B7666F|nr:hypothetical protein [Gilvimarinus sp. DA14]UTF59886.1 hypothetical protein NHM04_15650 [Gilvimarinus sp. DA14]
MPTDTTNQHETNALRGDMFALAQTLGANEPHSSVAINAEFARISASVHRALENSATALEPGIRDYDPLLANRLEDGNLRLAALLAKLAPRFACLTKLQGASLSAERYSLYLDWNLLLAEFLVQLDFHVRLDALLPREEKVALPPMRNSVYPGLFARCRERVRQYCACQ